MQLRLEGLFRSRSSQLAAFLFIQCGLLEGQPDRGVVAFLKLDRWIIMINATPLFMSIQA